MESHPETCAVLVRNHGVYVWGGKRGSKFFFDLLASWEAAKCMCECYDYLFELAVKMKGLGLDPMAAPPVPEEDKHLYSR